VDERILAHPRTPTEQPTAARCVGCRLEYPPREMVTCAQPEEEPDRDKHGTIPDKHAGTVAWETGRRYAKASVLGKGDWCGVSGSGS